MGKLTKEQKKAVKEILIDALTDFTDGASYYGGTKRNLNRRANDDLKKIARILNLKV